jgi:DNA-binding XRE family transcriptional regulator
MRKGSNTRNYLGLTQEQMAGLLGVSRSVINDNERGTRNVPQRDQSWDTNLDYGYYHGPLEWEYVRRPLVHVTKKEMLLPLKGEMVSVERQLRSAKQKLKAMRVDHQWLLKCLPIMERFLGIHPDREAPVHAVVYSRYMEAQTQLAKCDEVSQLKLGANIAALEIRLQKYREAYALLEQQTAVQQAEVLP